MNLNARLRIRPYQTPVRPTPGATPLAGQSPVAHTTTTNTIRPAAALTLSAAAVLEHLERYCFGRNKALKAQTIANVLDLSWRQVEKAVEELRNKNIFIASARVGAPRGLYLPATDAEHKDALGSFRRATLTQIRTYNRLKRARRLADRYAGQRSLFSDATLSAARS